MKKFSTPYAFTFLAVLIATVALSLNFTGNKTTCKNVTLGKSV